MHLFLAFGYIPESYSISRVTVLICEVEKAGKPHSVLLQPLSSVFLLSAPSWPQKAFVLELMLWEGHPWRAGSCVLLSWLLAYFHFLEHSGERHDFLRHSSHPSLSLPLRHPFPLFFSSLLFLPLTPRGEEAWKGVCVFMWMVERREEGISRCLSLPLGRKLGVFI